MRSGSDMDSRADPSQVLTCVEAADQDGHDGGFVAHVGSSHAWGATVEAAYQALITDFFDEPPTPHHTDP